MPSPVVGATLGALSLTGNVIIAVSFCFKHMNSTDTQLIRPLLFLAFADAMVGLKQFVNGLVVAVDHSLHWAYSDTCRAFGAFDQFFSVAVQCWYVVICLFILQALRTHVLRTPTSSSSAASSTSSAARPPHSEGSSFSTRRSSAAHDPSTPVFFASSQHTGVYAHSDDRNGGRAGRGSEWEQEHVIKPTLWSCKCFCKQVRKHLTNSATISHLAVWSLSLLATVLPQWPLGAYGVSIYSYDCWVRGPARWMFYAPLLVSCLCIVGVTYHLFIKSRVAGHLLLERSPAAWRLFVFLFAQLIIQVSSSLPLLVGEAVGGQASTTGDLISFVVYSLRGVILAIVWLWSPAVLRCLYARWDVDSSKASGAEGEGKGTGRGGEDEDDYDDYEDVYGRGGGGGGEGDGGGGGGGGGTGVERKGVVKGLVGDRSDATRPNPHALLRPSVVAGTSYASLDESQYRQPHSAVAAEGTSISPTKGDVIVIIDPAKAPPVFSTTVSTNTPMMPASITSAAATMTTSTTTSTLGPSSRLLSSPHPIYMDPETNFTTLTTSSSSPTLSATSPELLARRGLGAGPAGGGGVGGKRHYYGENLLHRPIATSPLTIPPDIKPCDAELLGFTFAPPPPLPTPPLACVVRDTAPTTVSSAPEEIQPPRESR